MSIIYKQDVMPKLEQMIELYQKAGIPRPTNDRGRMVQMLENSNIVISAWENDNLVGMIRALTDFVWYTFLADLAVHPDYQKSGVGKMLIEVLKNKVGEQTAIILLSVPSAMDYYPKVGFIKDDRAFSISRIK